MLLGDLNSQFEKAVEDLLGKQDNLLKLNHHMNQAVRLAYLTDAFGNTGRITSVAIYSGSVKMEVETPK